MSGFCCAHISSLLVSCWSVNYHISIVYNQFVKRYSGLSKTGAELLFELISQHYERGATIITSNLPFDEWTGTFGEERLTGALLDRLTHRVHILEMNGQYYRLAQSRSKRKC